MKISKNALREVLAVEIRSIVREEVQRELKAMFKSESRPSQSLKKTTKIKSPNNKYSVMDSLNSNDPITETTVGTTQPSPLNNKQRLDIGNVEDFNALLETTEVPSNYYQNSQVTGAASTGTQPGEVNTSFQPTSVQGAEDVDGENLNELENTNFGAFI